MDLAAFKTSLNQANPPPGISACLEALWYDGKGDWEKSHQIAQDIDTKQASWVHAYLHRKEGDLSNADYWYNRAGRKRPSVSLEKEWEQLCEEMMSI